MNNENHDQDKQPLGDAQNDIDAADASAEISMERESAGLTDPYPPEIASQGMAQSSVARPLSSSSNLPQVDKAATPSWGLFVGVFVGLAVIVLGLWFGVGLLTDEDEEAEEDKTPMEFVELAKFVPANVVAYGEARSKEGAASQALESSLLSAEGRQLLKEDRDYVETLDTGRFIAKSTFVSELALYGLEFHEEKLHSRAYALLHPDSRGEGATFDFSFSMVVLFQFKFEEDEVAFRKAARSFFQNMLEDARDVLRSRGESNEARLDAVSFDCEAVADGTCVLGSIKALEAFARFQESRQKSDVLANTQKYEELRSQLDRGGKIEMNNINLPDVDRAFMSLKEEELTKDPLGKGVLESISMSKEKKAPSYLGHEGIEVLDPSSRRLTSRDKLWASFDGVLAKRGDDQIFEVFPEQVFQALRFSGDLSRAHSFIDTIITGTSASDPTRMAERQVGMRALNEGAVGEHYAEGLFNVGASLVKQCAYKVRDSKKAEAFLDGETVSRGLTVFRDYASGIDIAYYAPHALVIHEGYLIVFSAFEARLEGSHALEPIQGSTAFRPILNACADALKGKSFASKLASIRERAGGNAIEAPYASFLNPHMKEKWLSQSVLSEDMQGAKEALENVRGDQDSIFKEGKAPNMSLSRYHLLSPKFWEVTSGSPEGEALVLTSSANQADWAAALALEKAFERMRKKKILEAIDEEAIQKFAESFIEDHKFRGEYGLGQFGTSMGQRLDVDSAFFFFEMEVQVQFSDGEARFVVTEPFSIAGNILARVPVSEEYSGMFIVR